jgi:hypothetical protein
MSRAPRLYDFAARQVRETERAILLDVGNDAPIWLPKSQVEDNGDGTYTVTEELATEKGIV